MDLAPGSWLRRLAAHLTTPLFAGLLGWLVLQGACGGDDLLATILICYALWVLTGAAGTLFVPRRGRQYRLPVYMAVGAVAMLPLAFPFSNEDLASLLERLMIVPLGAAVGAWYWFFAHWQPRAARSVSG